jgi:DNA-binding winged helix-turn-helix (wHTH) protein/TolB-like protein
VAAHQRIGFAGFTFDRVTRELFRDGVRVRVPLKPLLVLDILLGRPGELVSRDELRAALWSSDTFVDFDNNLNAAVRKLREVLEDDAEQPRFIETLPRRGYRFVGSLTSEQEAPMAQPGIAPVEQEPSNRWRQATALTLAAAALGIAWGIRPFQPPLVAVALFDNVSGDSTQAAIAEGLSNELATQLAIAKPSRYRVARTAQRADWTPDGVDYFIEGSTHRDESGLYVTARLVDAGRDELIWAGSFACPQGDAARIRRQLAQKIGALLAAALSSG